MAPAITTSKVKVGLTVDTADKLTAQCPSFLPSTTNGDKVQSAELFNSFRSTPATTIVATATTGASSSTLLQTAR